MDQVDDLLLVKKSIWWKVIINTIKWTKKDFIQVVNEVESQDKWLKIWSLTLAYCKIWLEDENYKCMFFALVRRVFFFFLKNLNYQQANPSGLSLFFLLVFKTRISIINEYPK